MRIATALLLALTVVGCYRVEADVSGLTTTAGDESFPAGGPATGQIVEVTRSISMPTDSPLVHDLLAARVDSVLLSPKSGVTTLDFLTGVTMILRGSQGIADVKLADDNALSMSGDGSIRVPVNTDVDPKLFSSSLTVDATLRFVAQPQQWTLGIQAALSLHGSTDLKL